MNPSQVIARKHLQRLAGEGEYLFPSVCSFARPISDNTLNAAIWTGILARQGSLRDHPTFFTGLTAGKYKSVREVAAPDVAVLPVQA